MIRHVALQRPLTAWLSDASYHTMGTETAQSGATAPAVFLYEKVCYSAHRLAEGVHGGLGDGGTRSPTRGHTVGHSHNVAAGTTTNIGGS
jgi:hypothetical protein